MTKAVEDDNLGSDSVKAKSLVARKQSRKIERKCFYTDRETERRSGNTSIFIINIEEGY